MATATLDPTTTAEVNAIWRKVQTGLRKGLNFEVEEFDHLTDLEKFKANMSTREVLVPLDIQEPYGVASIPEDGWEARPSTPNARELSLSWIIQNKRFTITKQARWVSQHSREAMLEDQFKYMGMKAIQALAARVGDYVWGFSTGYLAQVDDAGGALTAGTSHTITLKNGYGLSGITDAEYVTRLFRTGDYVALIASSALVTNAIGEVTDRSLSAGTIDVTWIGSADPDDDDFIVLANSMENTTIDGTDFNRGATGWLDMATSTSVHNLSSATEENWDLALSDTSGNRLTGVRIREAKQEIQNYGGGSLTDLWIAQGVERDMVAQYQASVRFSNPMGMEVDGSVKAKDVTMHSSRRTPPGTAIGYDKGSMFKFTLLPEDPSEPAWEDGEKIEHRPIWAFGIDFPWNMVVTNRKNMAYWSGLTEQ